ncbi:carboxypeptidase regulatory-like domain-containing protein [Terriglobus sp. 2YAB30_2]|uniref:carboxypeptidase regulatory-like domain-containing protein n=2 Tax=unclassified Terriglobus TaxID=2628988 RepID=UPI003F96FD8D
MQVINKKEIKWHQPLRRVWMRPFFSLALSFPGVVSSALAVTLVSATAAFAQTGQGSISGTIRDSQGDLVPGARIEVISDATKVSQVATTNNAGLFQIQSLNPGAYTVVIAKEGFEKTTVKAVNVSGVGATPIDVMLTLGATTETVTVNSDAELISKTDTDVVTTVDNALVLNLPYPERSSLGAALLVPGVEGDPLQPGGISTENPGAFTSYVTPGAGIVIGGAPPGTSSIVVDGSDVTQASLARTGVNLSGRQVQEATVIVTGLSAKYGRTGGGVIVQSSAPGTSNYHGAISWRHTDPYFNAFPDGNTAPSALRENYYGFYVGGPIWIPKVYPHKDKSFFFVGIEPARMQNSFGFRGIFPTPDELSGKLHNSLALLNQSILKSQGYAAALLAPRIGAINYQSTVDANGFPNGPYDASQIHAVPNDDVSAQLSKNQLAQFVLSQFPTPSNPGPYIKFDNAQATSQNDGTNATYKRGVINKDNRYSFRIDHHFNDRDQLFVRYTVIPVNAARFFAVDPSNPLTIVPTDAANTHDIALGYSHVFTNNIATSFHYSFMRVNQQRLAPPSTRSKDYAGAYGLTPASFGYGFPSLGNLNANGVGYTMQMGLSNAAIQVDQNFIAGDDITWTHGRHVVEFGADIRWLQSSQYDLGGATGGRYSFTANSTNNGSTGGAPLASFILGSIASFSNTPVAVPGYYRWRYYAGYIQDKWRITPNFTIDAGVRYELETPRMEKFNNQAYINLSTAGNLNGLLPTTSAFCFSGACGNPQSLWPINYKGIEPRVGFVYAPTPKTSIRAAYTLQRLPLTGYENNPDPNFNVASQAVGGQSGGVTPNSTVNYITNPVGPLTSAYTALAGNRGPILYSTGLSPVFVNQSNAVPYTQTWSFTVQYQPAARTVVQATYNGSKGTHLIGPFTNALNIPSFSTLVNAIQTHQNLGASAPNKYGIMQNGSLVSESNLQLLNPYQNFYNQPLPEIYPRGGTMEYNGLYLSVNQRFGHGLSALANYTWSKIMDNIPDTNTGANGGGFGFVAPQDPTNPYAEWAVASFDQASRLKIGYTYDLPIGSGHSLSAHNRLLDNIIGNISTAGIATYADGLPNSVILGSGNAGYFVSVTPSGTNGCTASGSNKYCTASALPANYGYTLRPDIVPGVPLINKDWKKNALNSNFTPYLNPAAFAVPGSVNSPRLGNAPRTLPGARSPREALFDMRFNKGIKFESRYAINVNATFSNVFNHPVYYGVGRSLLSSTTVSNITGAVTPVNAANFGQFNQSQTAGMSRVIRIGAEFTF